MNETTVQPYKPAEIVNIEDYAMNVEGLTHQVQLIQNVMEKIMNDGEHYGVIPGTNKPTLLKPGAEKLCLTFRLDPQYDIIREVRDKDFIAYTIKCNLTHIPTTLHIASGIGSCNSRETKYRYRNEFEMTEKAVPKAYWDARNSNNSKEMKRLLDGHVTRKNEETGQWVLAKATRVENDNPWDLDNTLIKMACKRALVAATLNATAASDIFTQDVDDMPREMLNGNQSGGKKKKPNPRKPAKSDSKKQNGHHADSQPPPKDNQNGEEVPAWATELDSMRKAKLFHFGGKNGLDEIELANLCSWYAQGAPLTKSQAINLIDNFEEAIKNWKADTSQ